MAFRLVVDFDGTLHDHHNIPEGETMGPPIEGALEAITALRRRYDVVVMTARDAPGREQARKWLADNGFPDLMVTNIKFPAVAYIDDHGLHFQGWDQTLKDFKRIEHHLVQGYLKDAPYNTTR